MTWQNNDPGFECSCGAPLLVKVEKGTGEAMLLCLFHTSEAGACFPIPREKPDGWNDLTEDQRRALVIVYQNALRLEQGE
jgi:hypothetical protein